MAVGQRQTRRCTQNPRNDGARERKRVSRKFPQQARGASAAGEASQDEAHNAQRRCFGFVQVSSLQYIWRPLSTQFNRPMNYLTYYRKQLKLNFEWKFFFLLQVLII